MGKTREESLNNIVQTLAKVSLSYSDEAANAKTLTKRKYFVKKLKRNNVLISDLIANNS